MFTSYFWKKIALSFARAFIGVFVLSFAIPTDLTTGKQAVLALVGAAAAAGLRAAQAMFTQLETDEANKPPA